MTIESVMSIALGVLGMINGVCNLVKLCRGTFDYSDWCIASDSMTIIFLSLMVFCSAFMI